MFHIGSSFATPPESGSAERNGSPARTLLPRGRGIEPHHGGPACKARSTTSRFSISHALAGPLASTLLADFGARVIKLETPGSGDIARKWGPPFYGEDSAYFVALNRNKKSVEIDLKHPQGKELFFRLLDRADVLLENLRVGTVDRLGIDYAATRARNPASSTARSPDSARTGPYRERAASISRAGGKRDDQRHR